MKHKLWENGEVRFAMLLSYKNEKALTQPPFIYEIPLWERNVDCNLARTQRDWRLRKPFMNSLLFPAATVVGNRACHE